MHFSIRPVREADRETFLTMSREFYGSDAVLHPIAEAYHTATFEELIGSERYLKFLSDAEKSDEFVIKCSPQDYSYISENQGKIFCNMSKDITLDITTDETLGKNDCIIETDGAVFDCSLDKELANLTKKIKMLSCLD